MSPRAVIIELVVVAVLAGGLAWWWRESGVVPEHVPPLRRGGEIGRVRDGLHAATQQSIVLLANADEAGLLAAWLPPDRAARMAPEVRAEFEARVRAATENIRRGGLAQFAVPALYEASPESYALGDKADRAVRSRPPPAPNADPPVEVIYAGPAVSAPRMPDLVWIKVGDRWVPENVDFLQYFLDLDAAAERARAAPR